MSNFYKVYIDNQATRLKNCQLIKTATGNALDKFTIREYDDVLYETRTYLKAYGRNILMVAQYVGQQDKQDVYIDYITGRRLDLTRDNYHCFNTHEGYQSDKVLFSIGSKIESPKVTEIWRSLSTDDVYNYADAFSDLEHAIRQAYIADKNYVDKDEKSVNDFRKKFWK